MISFFVLFQNLDSKNSSQSTAIAETDVGAVGEAAAMANDDS